MFSGRVLRGRAVGAEELESMRGRGAGLGTTSGITSEPSCDGRGFGRGGAAVEVCSESAVALAGGGGLAGFVFGVAAGAVGFAGLADDATAPMGRAARRPNVILASQSTGVCSSSSRALLPTDEKER